MSTDNVSGLEQVAGHARADAVTTTGSEVSLKSTVAVAERLGLPFYADSETIRRCQDKDAMRAGYAAAGMATPPFARCGESLRRPAAFASQRGIPSWSSRHEDGGSAVVARVCENEVELAHAFADALRTLVACRPASPPSSWRRGLARREYSVNGVGPGQGFRELLRVTERMNGPLAADRSG